MSWPDIFYEKCDLHVFNSFMEVRIGCYLSCGLIVVIQNCRKLYFILKSSNIYFSYWILQVIVVRVVFCFGWWSRNDRLLLWIPAHNRWFKEHTINGHRISCLCISGPVRITKPLKLWTWITWEKQTLSNCTFNISQNLMCNIITIQSGST